MRDESYGGRDGAAVETWAGVDFDESPSSHLQRQLGPTSLLLLWTHGLQLGRTRPLLQYHNRSDRDPCLPDPHVDRQEEKIRVPVLQSEFCKQHVNHFPTRCRPADGKSLIFHVRNQDSCENLDDDLNRRSE